MAQFEVGINIHHGLNEVHISQCAAQFFFNQRWEQKQPQKYHDLYTTHNSLWPQLYGTQHFLIIIAIFLSNFFLLSSIFSQRYGSYIECIQNLDAYKNTLTWDPVLCIVKQTTAEVFYFGKYNLLPKYMKYYRGIHKNVQIFLLKSQNYLQKCHWVAN